MQRIHNLMDWNRVEDGGGINFAKPDVRRVRLDVNSPGPVALHYADGNGEVTFLARVVGRDVIEFKALGPFSITVEGGDCYFQSVDGEDFSFVIPDAAIITKMVTRRARNPEMEYIAHMANVNIENRMRQLRAEMERDWAQRIKPPGDTPLQPPAPSAAGGSGKEPKPDKPAAGGSGDKSADSGSPAAEGTGEAKK